MEFLFKSPELNPGSTKPEKIKFNWRRRLYSTVLGSTVLGLTSLTLAALPHQSSAQQGQDEVLIFCVREGEMVQMSSPGSDNPRINGEEYPGYYAVIVASPEERLGAVVKYRLPITDRSSGEILKVSETVSQDNLRVVTIPPGLGREFQHGVGFLKNPELLREMSSLEEILDWLPYGCFPRVLLTA